MASTKIATVEITCNTKRAKEAIKEYERLASEAMNSLANLTRIVNQNQKNGIEITKEQAKQMKKLEEDIKIYTSAQQRGIDDMKKAKEVLNDLANSSIKEVNKAIRDMTKSMNGMRDISGIRKVQGDIDTLRKALTEKLKPAVGEVMKDLKNVNNLSFDKLQQNIETLRSKWNSMTEAQRNSVNGRGISNALTAFEAQAAVVKSGRAGNASLDRMTNEQLQAERSRLAQAYSATEGSAMHATISKEYLDRLHQVNQLLKERADKERELEKIQRDQAAAQQQQQHINDIWTRWHQNQKVSLSELIELQKHWQEELKSTNGINIGQGEQDRVNLLRNNLNIIKEEIEKLTKDPDLDINKMLADIDNQPLEKLEAGLKQLQEESKKLTANSPFSADQIGRQMEAFQQKIDQIKQSMEEVKQLDIDNMLQDWNIDDQPLEKIEQALKQIEAEEKKLTANMTDDAERIRTQREKLLAQQKKIKQATIDYASAEKMAGETGKHSVTELQKAYDTLKQKLMGLNTGQKAEIEKTRENMAKLKKAIDETSGSIIKQGGIWQTAVKNITAYVGVFGAFNFIKGKLTDVIRLNLELSDSMANIRKVSGLAMSDIQDLTRTLAKMDTRTPLAELEEIAYRGAKLGFGNFGTQGLLEFAQAANVVNVALKEDLGDEALAALSKITENMGLIKKMGVEDAMLATGSAMFQLAASSTAAAGPIVEVTKRLVPVAQMSGFATHEILALASASDSLHLMPEVVGTALSKLIMALQNNHNLVEKYLGIDEGTIAQLFKAGDAMDALLLVFDKMNGKNVTELDDLWKLLGSDGQRLITVVADMANHTDTLRTHLQTSTKAFKEATAVTDEYNIQQETAAALIERANNAWRNAFVNPDAEQNVKGLAKAWYDFSKGLLESELTMKGVTLALNLLLGSLRLLLSMLPALSVFAIVKMFNKLRVAMMESKIATDMFTTSWKNMTTATKANWVGLILGAVTQLAFWIKNAASESDDLATSQKKLQDAMSASQGKAEEEISSLARLKGQLENATTAEEDRAKILDKVKSDYDHYLNYLGVEINTVDELTRHYDALTKVMKQRFAYQEREDYKRENLQGIKQERRNAGADLKRMGKEMGLNVDLSLVDQYVKSGTKNAGEAFMKMFPDIEKTIASRQKTGMGGGQYGDFSKQFAAYFGKVRTEVEQTQKIDEAFAEEIGDFDYDKYLRTQIKGDFKVKPDKAAEKAARKAAQEEKQALRKELQDAKQESDAIIAKIEEWYRLQETVVTGFAADGVWTQQQAETINRELEAAKNEALANARLAISGRDTQTWEKTKQNIKTLMFDTGKWSQELFQQMMDASMANIRTNLDRIDQEGGQYGITTTSMKDALDKNAAGNRRKVQELRNKTAKEVEKALLKYNYFEQAARAYEDRLTQLGLLTETAEQAAKRLNGLKASTKTEEQLTRDRSTARRQAGDQFRKNPAASYSVDVESTESLHSWLQGITGAQGGIGTGGFEWQFSGWAKAFEDDFGKWLTDSETYKEDIQAFYLTLADYDRQYYDAVGQHRDKMVKDAKTRWETSDEGRLYSSAEKELGWESRERKMYGQDQGTNFGQMAGFYNINDDPEIQMSLLRMAQYETELQAFKEENEAKKLEGAALDAYQQELFEREQQRQELERQAQESLMQHINDHISRLNQWTEPIQQFATDVGDAMGQAIVSGESMSEAMQNALKSLVQSWGQSTIQIVKELMMQQLKQKLIGKTMVKQEKQTQESLSQSDEEGGEKRLKATNIVETGMASVMQTMGQQILAQKQTQDQAEMSSEATKTTGTVMAGIAQGAAKIIGTLGPWGAPLIAVITALLMGLLSAALGALFGGGSGDKGGDTSTKKKVKLASGMLTYDSGNVQETVGQQWRGKHGEYITDTRQTVIGDDGRVYRARRQAQLPSGVKMITEPIATTVNGQQALVAERGPEIVIGRKTTRAIQMNRPDLLRDLMMFDRGMTTRKARTFDEGNLSDLASAIMPTTDQPTPTSGGDPSSERQALIERLDRSDQLMQQVIYYLQNPVAPNINMYGENGLHKKIKQADKFLKQYGG